jgi:hypothetical protein
MGGRPANQPALWYRSACYLSRKLVFQFSNSFNSPQKETGFGKILCKKRLQSTIAFYILIYLFFPYLLYICVVCFTIACGETNFTFLPIVGWVTLPWYKPLGENRLLNSWHKHIKSPHFIIYYINEASFCLYGCTRKIVLLGI